MEGKFLYVTRNEDAMLQYLEEYPAVAHEVDPVTLKTPLHIACAAGYLKVVMHLVNAGVDTERVDEFGDTPLENAEIKGHTHIASFFEGLVASETSDKKDRKKASEDRQSLLAQQSIDTSKSEQGLQRFVGKATPALSLIPNLRADSIKSNHDAERLWVASFEGNAEEVRRWLLNLNVAEVNSVDKTGQTPLYAASAKGHLNVASQLITAGAKINQTSNEGTTPLFVASAMGHFDIVECLVIAGAEVDKVAKEDGTTPLLMASIMDHAKIAECLVNAGADVNQADKDGVSPLFFACQSGHLRVVEGCAQVGADLNKARDDGVTPLLIAIMMRRLKIVQCLVKAGADTNKAMNNGFTPLLVATANGDIQIIEYLVMAKAGSKVNKAEKDGRTPHCQISSTERC